MTEEIRTKIIEYYEEKEEEYDEWYIKSIAIASSKDWFKATKIEFVADNDKKNKIETMGVTYFTLACTKNTFRVIKNQKTAIGIIVALEDRYKEA